MYTIKNFQVFSRSSMLTPGRIDKLGVSYSWSLAGLLLGRLPTFLPSDIQDQGPAAPAKTESSTVIPHAFESF
jgi:hypothetical protein